MTIKALEATWIRKTLEESINESVNTSDESVSETNQTGSESNSD